MMEIQDEIKNSHRGIVLVHNGKAVFFDGNDISQIHKVSNFEQFLLWFATLNDLKIRSRVIKENSTAAVILGQTIRSTKMLQIVYEMSNKIGASLNKETISSLIGIDYSLIDDTGFGISQKREAEEKPQLNVSEGHRLNDKVDPDSRSYFSHFFSKNKSVRKESFAVAGIIASIVLLTILLPGFESDVDRLLIDAKIDFSKGQFENAIARFNHVLEINPQNVNALNGLGNTYLAIEDYDSAKSYFEMVLEINPINLSAFNGLGRTYLAIEDYDNAKLNYEMVLNIDADNVDALNGLGNTYLAIEDYDSAKLNYEMVLDIDAENITAMKGKAIIYSNNQEFKLAMFWYDEILKRDTKNTFALSEKMKIKEFLE